MFRLPPPLPRQALFHVEYFDSLNKVAAIKKEAGHLTRLIVPPRAVVCGRTFFWLVLCAYSLMPAQT